MIRTQMLSLPLAAILAANPAPKFARADDDALKAIITGIGVLNALQQQQQQRQNQLQQRQQQQTTPPRQPRQQKGAVASPTERQQSEEVRQVQEYLNSLGYDAGPVDGQPGPRTRSAIAAFRSDFGLAPGAAVDPELMGALQVARRGTPGPVNVTAEAQRPSNATAPAGERPAGRHETTLETLAVLQDDIPVVDGRLVAVTQGQTSISALQHTSAFKNVDLGTGLRRLIFAYAVRLAADPLAEDDAALEAIGFIPPALAIEILEQGLQRPLTQQQQVSVQRNLAGNLVRSLSPFEAQDVILAVQANASRIVRADLPVLPVPIRVYCAIDLSPYDFASNSFRVTSDSCGMRVLGAERAKFAGASSVPSSLPMEADEAKIFQPGNRSKRYLASFDAELDASGSSVATADVTVNRLPGLRLYSEGSASDVVYEFHPAASSGDELRVEDGIPYIDGRIAVAFDGGVSEYLASNNLLRGVDLTRPLLELLFQYRAEIQPDVLSDDGFVMSLLRRQPIGTILDVFEEADVGLGPLADQKTIVQSGLDPFSVVSMTEFERRRLTEVARAHAEAWMPQGLPEPPIPLRVFCPLRLFPYDFSRQVSPVQRYNCALLPAEADGVSFVVRDASPPPEEIPLPPEVAEEVYKQGRLLLASFDAALDLSTRNTESGPEFVATITDARPYQVYAPGSYTKVISASASGKLAPGEAGGQPDAGDRVIEDLASLRDVAGPSLQFPADGRALLAEEGSPVGRFESTNFRIGEDPEPLFTARNDLAARVAAALGLPPDYIKPLQIAPGSSYDETVLALLPAPATQYRAEVPADRYGRTSLDYQWSGVIDAAHSFEMPGGASLLLLRVRPDEGRILDGGSSHAGAPPGKLLGLVDLRAEEMPPALSPLVVPPRAAFAMGAFTTAGIDPVAGMSQMLERLELNAFERQDLAEKLVGLGRSVAEPPESLWVSGRITFGDYDMASGEFPATRLSLGPMEVLRPYDLGADRFRLDLPDGAFNLEMEPEAARRLFDAHPELNFPVRALLHISGARFENGRVNLDASVVEAELLREGATDTVRDPKQVVVSYRIDTPEQAAAAAAAALKHWDILGLTIGAPFDASAASAEAAISADGEFILDRTAAEPFAQGAPYGRGRLLHATEAATSIALFGETSREGSDVVTAILRSQSFAEGARPKIDAVTSLLIDRYGEPAQRKIYDSFQLFLWTGAQPDDGNRAAYGVCLGRQDYQLERAAVPVSIQYANGPGGFGATGSPWSDAASGQPWASPEASLIDPAQAFTPQQAQQDDTDCAVLGEVLGAVVFRDASDRAQSLQVLLSDPARAAALARTPGHGVGATEEPIPEIKL